MRAGSAITGNVIAFSAADTFRLGGTGNASFDASSIGTQYQGFGAFEKTGSSNWTLTGTATQVNAWSVNAGTLSVNGNLSVSTITVNAGATLGGNGTVGNTTINGGTLAPGNSIGTLTVQGNLLLTAGVPLYRGGIAFRLRPHKCVWHGNAGRRDGHYTVRRRQLRVEAVYDRPMRPTASLAGSARW